MLKNFFISTVTLLIYSYISSQSVQAASVQFGKWTLGKPTVTNSTFGNGNGSATPNTLKATAGASIFPLDLNSYGIQNATTTISLNNTFKIIPGSKDKAGDKAKGILFGKLEGNLIGTGFDFAKLTGSFNTSVEASADAGFASFSDSDSFGNSVLILDAAKKSVKIPFRKVGIVTIGETYPFNMNLAVSAEKNGAYQALSNFGTTFTANVSVEPVPEPLTIFGTATALGIGTVFKKKYSKKKAKSKAA
ncbi:MAG: PEP-CTERM sorting domain-containing protein [Cyanobacteria bacterium P01_D01_bin.116]